jgi:HEAT repeat protein
MATPFRPLAAVAAASLLLAACAPKIDSKDPSERERAVATVQDPALLVQIARTDANEDVRNSAVSRLTDQKLLGEIALADTSSLVASTAIGLLHDEAALEKVATTRTDYVARDAASKITTPAVLARLVSSSQNDALRADLAARIDDQEVLANLVAKDADSAVQTAALARLTDQRRLGDLALGATSSYFADRVVERISDQTQLARIVRAPGSSCTESALAKLTDPALLLQLALETRNWLAHGMDRVGLSPSLYPALLQKIADARKLARIVIEGRSPNLAEAAKAAITDPEALAEIERFERHCNEISECTDPARLATWATQDTNRNVRLAAIGKHTDQPTLARVATADSDPLLRLAATDYLADQAVLAQMACNDTEAEVRIAAVARLHDPETFARIARTDREPSVRKTAVDQLTDNRVLGEIALADTDEYVRRTAIDKLTDDRALAEVARRETDVNLRRSAISKLGDQTALASIARSDSDEYARADAVERLDDQAVLAAIARADPSGEVRATAIERLTDSAAALGEIALQEKEAKPRAKAVALLTDQKILERVATTDTEAVIRETAVGRLEDPQTLARILETEKSGFVRKTAAACIKDQALLEKLAANDPGEDVRCAVVRNLDSVTALVRRALDDEKESVRLTAAQRLAELDSAEGMAALFAAMSAGPEPTRARACDALLAYQASAEAGMLAALAHPDPLTRRLVAEAAHRMYYGDRLVEPLLALLADPDAGVRRFAASALSHLGEWATEKAAARLPQAPVAEKRYLLHILADSTQRPSDAQLIDWIRGEPELRWHAAQLALGCEPSEDSPSELDPLRRLVRENRFAEAAAAGPLGAALCSVQLADWGNAPKVAAALRQAGWHPASDTERVLFTFAEHCASALIADVGGARMYNMGKILPQLTPAYRAVCAQVFLDGTLLNPDGQKRACVAGFNLYELPDAKPELRRMLRAAGTKEMAESFLMGDLGMEAIDWAIEHHYTLKKSD